MEDADQVDWSTAEAGREMDAAVARQTGRQPVRSITVIGRGGPRREIGTVDAPRMMADGRIGVSANVIPRYSTEIAAAWPLALEYRMSVVYSEDGFYAFTPEDIEHGCVRGTDVPTITLHAREHERPKPAPTAELAICRALLASTVHP